MNIYDKWHSLSAQVKHSVLFASNMFAVLSAVLGVVGYSLNICWPNMFWGMRLLIIVVIFVALFLLDYLRISFMYKSAVTLNIRGIKVNIKVGDLFCQEGLKIIPFNEHYDTLVDEKVVTSNTLHGDFIKNHVKNLKKLNQAIEDDAKESGVEKNSGGKFCFELGHLICFDDYLLLAFSKFDEQNCAHISMQEYEQCMFHMWSEVRRLYANRPIVLPLIGSGITSFDGVSEKSSATLLRCILCTLHASGEHINQPVTIVLRKEALEGLDLYELKWKLKI